MWIMSLQWTAKPTECHVFIGQVKIAEICFRFPNPRWKVYMRLMRNDVSFRTKDYESMAKALSDLHEMLNSPPPETKEYVQQEMELEDG